MQGTTINAMLAATGYQDASKQSLTTLVSSFLPMVGGSRDKGHNRDFPSAEIYLVTSAGQQLHS